MVGEGTLSGKSTNLIFRALGRRRKQKRVPNLLLDGVESKKSGMDARVSRRKLGKGVKKGGKEGEKEREG